MKMNAGNANEMQITLSIIMLLHWVLFVEGGGRAPSGLSQQAEQGLEGPNFLVSGADRWLLGCIYKPFPYTDLRSGAGRGRKEVYS